MRVRSLHIHAYGLRTRCDFWKCFACRLLYLEVLLLLLYLAFFDVKSCFYFVCCFEKTGCSDDDDEQIHHWMLWVSGCEEEGTMEYIIEYIIEWTIGYGEGWVWKMRRCSGVYSEHCVWCCWGYQGYQDYLELSVAEYSRHADLIHRCYCLFLRTVTMQNTTPCRVCVWGGGSQCF